MAPWDSNGYVTDDVDNFGAHCFFYYICFSIFPSNFIDSESGMKYALSYEYKDWTRDVIEHVTIRLVIGHYLPIGDPLEQSLYLQPFSKYWPLRALGSRR